jgi:hypothetical protein
MCKAFSCLVDKNKKVYWEFAKDAHDFLVDKYFKDKDTTTDIRRLEFARVEISPENNNYLKPDKWVFKIDENLKSTWLSEEHEKACWSAWKLWKKQLDETLDKILIKKDIVYPFKIEPPKITIKVKRLLKTWDSVWASVGDSVWASVGASVWDSVRDSVWASVGDSVGDSVRASVGASVRDSVRDSVRASVWASVGDSVWDSVYAYIGSLFNLKRSDWKHTEKIKTKGYPFQSCVDLWNMGLVPSFDEKVWRLHGKPDGKILFEISKEELKKVKP